MKLTEVLHGAQRKKVMEFRQHYKKSIGNYRYMQVPVLRNTVATQLRRRREMPCQMQYSILMQCWKDADFQEGFCGKEGDTYLNCMQKFQERAYEAKQQAQVAELDGTFLPGQKLSHAQANKLLKMYPSPKYDFKITHDFGKPLKKPLVFKEEDKNTLHSSIHKKIWKRS